jgi:acetylornithine deacetylase/succinyl-diaminopimelate desuccinylase-like protein
MHFTWLLHGIERMMLTGKPSWNVERTLLTSGALDALLLSLKENQRRVERHDDRHLRAPALRGRERELAVERENALPQRATANVNCRLLPEDTVKDVMNEINQPEPQATNGPPAVPVVVTGEKPASAAAPVVVLRVERQPRRPATVRVDGISGDADTDDVLFVAGPPA